MSQENRNKNEATALREKIENYLSKFGINYYVINITPHAAQSIINFDEKDISDLARLHKLLERHNKAFPNYTVKHSIDQKQNSLIIDAPATAFINLETTTSFSRTLKQ